MQTTTIRELDILISDKTDCYTKSIISNKERHLKMITGYSIGNI